MKEGDAIDQLYVHPAVARTGVASALIDAIEKLARRARHGTLATDASDTAKPFSKSTAIRPVQRNTVEIDGVWLGNTRMTKALPPKPPRGQP